MDRYYAPLNCQAEFLLRSVSATNCGHYPTTYRFDAPSPTVWPLAP